MLIAEGSPARRGKRSQGDRGVPGRSATWRERLLADEAGLMALLEVRDIASGYGEVQISGDVSLRLEPGKLTTLVGSQRRGRRRRCCGPCMGLLRPWRGTVAFHGRGHHALLRRTTAPAPALVLVPEGRQLFTDMSVLENLEMGAICPARTTALHAQPRRCARRTWESECRATASRPNCLIQKLFFRFVKPA